MCSSYKYMRFTYLLYYFMKTNASIFLEAVTVQVISRYGYERPRCSFIQAVLIEYSNRQNQPLKDKWKFSITSTVKCGTLCLKVMS